MSPELVMYYRGESLKTIAEASGTKTKTISNRLRKERIRLGYKNRPQRETWTGSSVTEFLADRTIVIELAKCGFNNNQIAEKWDVDSRTVAKYLEIWGRRIDVLPDIKSISLSELYNNWSDVHEDMIVTVNKRPMFKLVRLV